MKAETVTYRIYKNEFHSLFLAFLKADDSMDSNMEYNFWREIISETENVLTIRTHEINVDKIQNAMFKTPIELANLIWNN